jgi:hypothetical protein
MHTRFLSALFCAAFALAGAARAHDVWIEPTRYRTPLGERVDLDLRVGEQFQGESVERNAARILRFTATDARGVEEAILGIDKRAPAGLWKPKSAGLFLVGYQSDKIALELEAAKFERYLAEEGLEHVIAARRTRGESAKQGREAYSRSVKSLVLAFDKDRPAAAATGFDRRLGLPLEIVPEVDPHVLRSGDELALRVWFQDAPLAGILVGCQARSTPEREVRLRTDENGRVRFRVEETGPMLVRACWMVAAPAGAAADWHSTWTSLTFEVPPVHKPANKPVQGHGCER